MTIAWVVGNRGLLGSALCRALRRSGVNLFTPAEHFRWDSESEINIQLTIAVQAFAALVGVETKWQIYWAAGVGTMGSTASEVAVETRILSTLLGLVEFNQELKAANGCIAFASSAGAIYAAATDDIISENTTIAPTTAYAREKLKQENLVSAFVLANSRVTALLARISTLYGPGQAVGKQQGLVALIARRMLRNQPIQIYVPFDTIRDYIVADDAAAAIIATLQVISEKKSGAFIKIIASEQPTSIAEIISIYKRIARRTPRIVTSVNKLSSIYTRSMRFHSTALPIGQTCKTSLLVGIAQVMTAERFAYTRPSVKIF